MTHETISNKDKDRNFYTRRPYFNKIFYFISHSTKTYISFCDTNHRDLPSYSHKVGVCGLIGEEFLFLKQVFVIRVLINCKEYKESGDNK